MHEEIEELDLPREPKMLEEIEDLYAYDRWANHRILEAAARLSPDAFVRQTGSSFPSIRDTLVHILAAEWVWLSRWGGHSPTAMPEAWDASTVDTLREEWTKVEDDQKAFLSNLDERGLRETIAYRDTKGNPFRQPLWQMLRHVVNHSTYHRGQIVTMLRQLGAEAPATDMILFHRERSPRPRPEPTS